MGHWYYSYRSEQQMYERIDIRQLKKYGMLDYDYNRGSFGSQNQFDVIAYMEDSGMTDGNGYLVKVHPIPSIVITYKKNNYSGDIITSDCEVTLKKDPCNLRGWRYWFICPCCEKTVGILYLKSVFWACRTCHKLCYASQNENRMWASLFMLDKLDKEIGKFYEKIKHPYYSGKPTRLKRKLIKLEAIADALLEWKSNIRFSF